MKPLSEKADLERLDAFARYVAEADGSVYFKTSAPAIEGHAGTFHYGRTLDSFSLSLHRIALHDQRWRTPTQRLFTQFADSIGAVLATAEVVRNVDWSGRSLGYCAETERTAYLAARDGWVGLPPYPVWWTWFGPDYVPLVREHLATTQVAVAGSGLFHWRAEQPADRDQLAGRRSDGGARGWLHQLMRRKPSREATAAWLPADLLAIQPTFDPKREAPPFLKPARTRPSTLL